LTVTIRRPDAPNHFMVLRPVDKKVVIRLSDGPVLAVSERATRVMESGKTLYDPVLYIPLDDVTGPLVQQSNHSFCPLKGDARYFDYTADGGTIENLAWTYPDPLPFSQAIKGHIAFYADKVVIEEHPLPPVG